LSRTAGAGARDADANAEGTHPGQDAVAIVRARAGRRHDERRTTAQTESTEADLKTIRDAVELSHAVTAWIIMKPQHWLNLAYASATSIAIVLAWLIVGK
jgi:hypothetical protein